MVLSCWLGLNPAGELLKGWGAHDKSTLHHVHLEAFVAVPEVVLGHLKAFGHE